MRGNQTSSCREYPCLLYRKGGTEAAPAMISDEIAWDLWLNGRCVRHMTSSPHELDVLAVGYCLQQGLIEDGQAIRAFYETRGVSVAVVGVKQALASSRKAMTVTAEWLCSYGTLLDELSAAHHVTHGVHEGALVQDGIVLAYAEDVSRYNVLDRLVGEVYLRDIDPSQAVLVFSGRVPQQVAEKASSLGVSCLASRAMATSAGIEAAARLGLTLVCALRNESLRVFAHEERILVK